MVLDSVIRPTREKASNSSPSVTEVSMSSDNSLILLRGEGAVLDLRRELIAPAEAAGLTRTARNGFADERPVAWAMLLNQSLKGIVFLRAPWTLDPIHVFTGKRHEELKKRRV